MNKLNKLVLTVLSMSAGSGSVVCMDLFEASKTGDIERIRELIAAGADVDGQDEYGWAPLSFAVTRGYQEIVNVLINAHANVNRQNKFGMAPLSYAAANGRQEVVQALIDAGADVDRQNIYGVTPLGFAAANGHKKVVQALIAAGARVNVQDAEGGTPLYLATRHGRKEVVQVLVGYTDRMEQALYNTRDHMLTMAQGLHARLGAESSVALVSQDVLGIIGHHVAQAEECGARQPKTASRLMGCVVA